VVCSLIAASAPFRTSPEPFIALAGAGFAIGVLGHLAGSRFLVGLGIAIIFLATLLIPVALGIYR
jgi:hypothetical protein